MSRQMLEADARAALSFSTPPSWVNYAPFEHPNTPTAHGVFKGAFNWLFEEQICIKKPAIEWYYRTIDEVVKATSLEDLASISIDFDPAYESVHFHHARIIREGKTIEVPIETRYILMRREKGFESSMLDGQWTLGATLPDVRVGDIIDVAFTCSGMPAIFEDRFGPSLWMQGNQYHHCRRVRLLNPHDRPLNYKPFIMGCVEPKIAKLSDGFDEIIFEDNAVEPYYWEPNTPKWLRMWRGFYVSNVATWGEIAELERHGYERDLNYPPELLGIIARIEQTHSDPSMRIVEALRYVQDTIRYFSVSMGTGGYVPRPLDDIYNNRMGDCKDVSKLLVAILTKLGIEAYPALVDTQFGLDLANTIPRIWAFDHAIVLVVHEGKNYWFDATSIVQFGRLDVIEQADFGYALPLKAGADILPMASGMLAGKEGADRQDVPLIYEVVETIHLPKSQNGVCKIEIDYIYRRMTADYMRYSLSHKRLDNFAKDTCELYGHIYGHSTQCSLPQIIDNRDENELIIRQYVETNDPWLDTGLAGTKLFISPESAFGRILENPDGRPRFFPYDLGTMRAVRLVTRLISDFKLDLPVKEKVWTFGPLSLTFKGEYQGKHYVAVREYACAKSYLLPNDKMALDKAQAQIEAFDRLSIIFKEMRVFSWRKGFSIRSLIWGGAGLLLVIGLAIKTWL